MKRFVVLHSTDTVATATADLAAGTIIDLGTRSVALIQAIPFGHKFALEFIAHGATVVKYGQAIGIATAPISAGAHVHTHNVASSRGRGDTAVQSRQFAAQKQVQILTRNSDADASCTITGWRRSIGRFGIRNHVLVIPTSVCASEVASRIASAVPGAVATPHQHGCCQVGVDQEQTIRILIGIGANPNVGAVLVVSLGCEGITAARISEGIKQAGTPVEALVIQESGGTSASITKGIQILQRFVPILAAMPKTTASVSELVLGLECGGSDASSGLVANPALGIASDRLVAAGGTSILSETTELIGAEHLLSPRCPDPAVAKDLGRMVAECEKRALATGCDLRGSQPTPGNIAGGLTSIEEKSLGCIHKAGEAPILSTLEAGERPKSVGLHFMDTPGQDIESITSMLAGGANIIVFTTGRGTPTGSPIAPVIKTTANARTAQVMKENIDADLSGVVDGNMSLDQAGDLLWRQMLAAANGQETCAEKNGHREFAITRIGPTF